jgi:alpha-ketoglutarate-dependent 2,4-dichlorophenoxyacetate dioxygenase
MEWLSGGDMVWWDNRYAYHNLCRIQSLTAAHRQSMHRSNPYLESMSARDVRRSTVIDDGPFAFGVGSQGNGAAK